MRLCGYEVIGGSGGFDSSRSRDWMVDLLHNCRINWDHRSRSLDKGREETWTGMSPRLGESRRICPIVWGHLGLFFVCFQFIFGLFSSTEYGIMGACSGKRDMKTTNFNSTENLGVLGWLTSLCPGFLVHFWHGRCSRLCQLSHRGTLKLGVSSHWLGEIWVTPA